MRPKPKCPTPVLATRHKDKRADIPTEELRNFVADDGHTSAPSPRDDHPRSAEYRRARQKPNSCHLSFYFRLSTFPPDNHAAPPAPPAPPQPTLPAK